jgi:hypothetical protein
VPAKYLYARPGTHQIVKKLGLSSYTDACRPLPAATPIAMARATAPSTFSLAFARPIFWLPAGSDAIGRIGRTRGELRELSGDVGGKPRQGRHINYFSLGAYPPWSFPYASGVLGMIWPRISPAPCTSVCTLA